MAKILIIEDDLAFGTMIQTWLRKKGFEVEKATSVGAALRLLQEDSQRDLILSDLRLPDHDGLTTLRWLHKQGLHIPFIVMTSYAEVQNAVLAMKSGANDYVAKPFHPDILLEKINEAIKQASSAPVPANSPATPTQQETPQQTTTQPDEDEAPKYIEGKSEASQQLYRYVSLVAPTPMSVLILGASGTGKEYVAHRIHELSSRADKPFFAIDCGAIPRDVAASEFFGHVKGAFTGAEQDKKGAFEVANGGTLFLDEMGNLSYDVQVQLLRALQERKIRPVGGTKEIDIDIRLVCATNENLPKAIAEGLFREDLYHRINEFTLHIPLLRERGTDIVEFANYFLAQANTELHRHITGFTPEAEAALMAYPWPGNLREMRNVIVRAALLAEQSSVITPLLLNLPGAGAPQAATPGASLAIKPSPDEELARINQALQQTGGNKSRAAQLLGIDRKTLYNKLKGNR